MTTCRGIWDRPETNHGDTAPWNQSRDGTKLHGGTNCVGATSTVFPAGVDGDCPTAQVEHSQRQGEFHHAGRRRWRAGRPSAGRPPGYGATPWRVRATSPASRPLRLSRRGSRNPRRGRGSRRRLRTPLRDGVVSVAGCLTRTCLATDRLRDAREGVRDIPLMPRGASCGASTATPLVVRTPTLTPGGPTHTPVACTASNPTNSMTLTRASKMFCTICIRISPPYVCPRRLAGDAVLPVFELECSQGQGGGSAHRRCRTRQADPSASSQLRRRIPHAAG